MENIFGTLDLFLSSGKKLERHHQKELISITERESQFDFSPADGNIYNFRNAVICCEYSRTSTNAFAPYEFPNLRFQTYALNFRTWGSKLQFRNFDSFFRKLRTPATLFRHPLPSRVPPKALLSNSTKRLGVPGFNKDKKNKKGNAISVTGRAGPLGCER
jgi:hypothetical protein